jgi:hypothetical protein
VVAIERTDELKGLHQFKVTEIWSSGHVHEYIKLAGTMHEVTEYARHAMLCRGVPWQSITVEMT